MEKTILLGLRNELSVEWTKGIFLFTGVSNTIVGIGFGLREDSLFWLIFGIIMICSGLSQCIYGLLAFSSKSKYAPRVFLNESLIYIREKVLKPGIEISWDKIKDIRMAHNSITFSTRDTKYEFGYRVNARTSLDIKSAVREMAQLKQIEVVGG